MSSECLKVCPDGIGVLQNASPGTYQVGMATADAMRKHRLALWPSQGVFVATATLQEAFDLVDAAEEAAASLLKVLASGGPKQFLSNQELRSLAEKYQVKPFSQAMEMDEWFSLLRNGHNS
jgi:rhamnulose-1-phosphate aldolase